MYIFFLIYSVYLKHDGFKLPFFPEFYIPAAWFVTEPGIFSIWGKQERNGAPEDSSMFPNARQVAGALRCSWAAIALIFAAAAVFSALCRRILAGSCVSIWQVLSFVSS